jgi:murein DD-endopeptidase MepM/ murein hydrolase activator NlpD
MVDTRNSMQEMGFVFDETTKTVELNTSSVAGWRTAMNKARSDASALRSDIDTLFAGLEVDKAKEEFDDLTTKVKEFKITAQGKYKTEDIQKIQQSWAGVVESMKANGASNKEIMAQYDLMRDEMAKTLGKGKESAALLRKAFGERATFKAVLTGEGEMRKSARIQGQVMGEELTRAMAKVISAAAVMQGIEPPKWVIDIENMLDAEAAQRRRRRDVKNYRKNAKKYGSTTASYINKINQITRYAGGSTPSGPSISPMTSPAVANPFTSGTIGPSLFSAGNVSSISTFGGPPTVAGGVGGGSVGGAAARAGVSGQSSSGGISSIDTSKIFGQGASTKEISHLIQAFVSLMRQMSGVRDEYKQLDESTAEVWSNQRKTWESVGGPTYNKVTRTISDTSKTAATNYKKMSGNYASAFSTMSNRWSDKDKPWLARVGSDLKKPFLDFSTYVDDGGRKGFLGKNKQAMSAAQLIFQSGANGIDQVWKSLPSQMGKSINPGLNELNIKVINPMKATLSAYPGGSDYANKMKKFPQYATGGFVSGPGTGTSDSIMARLSSGEFVMNSRQTKKYRRLLEMLNKGKKLSHNDIWNYIFGPGGGPWWDDRGARKSQRVLDHYGYSGISNQAPEHSLAWVLKALAQRGSSISARSEFAMVGPILRYGFKSLQKEMSEVGKVIQDKREAAYIPSFIHPLGLDHAKAVPTHDPNSRPGFTTRSVYNPGNGSYRPHGGADLSASSGDPLYAVSAGEVVLAGAYGDAGNFVKILFKDGMAAGYAHLSKIGVRIGQKVRAGQRIGRVGSTGNSTGPHLHFIIYDKNGTQIDPEKYMLNSHRIKLGRGGYVSPRAGGTPAILAEAGRAERVEPLNARGLSTRDKDIVDRLDRILGKQGDGAASVVNVYIGDEQLRQIVRTEIVQASSSNARTMVTGRRRLI